MVYSSKGKTKCHTLQKSPHDPVQSLFPVRAEKLLFPFLLVRVQPGSLLIHLMISDCSIMSDTVKREVNSNAEQNMVCMLAYDAQ